MFADTYDLLNRRWRKANRQAKGGWSAKAQWYAAQQERLAKYAHGQVVLCAECGKPVRIETEAKLTCHRSCAFLNSDCGPDGR
jgi:hypothetical protein